MGICLDTEQNQNHNMEGGERGANGELWTEDTAADFRYATTPPDGHFPMHNGGKVNFEVPRVPVIFVLGGPGSGKVTHCDNLMQEKKGIVHINMTDLLQQYAIGNDMQDFSQLSSRTVTEVLMLEMKMAPNAKTYLISGYPRSMRDVVEYSEKIQVVNGAILISWRQKVLERQIDYGAKLGQVVLSLARMELNNFFKNVMPVADYFDQSNMLIAVNGERHPGDVYKDFRQGVMRILGQQDNPPVFANGRVAAVPADVSTEQIPTRYVSQQENGGMVNGMGNGAPNRMGNIPPQNEKVITVTTRELEQNYSSPVKPGWPSVLWVIGGPGSGKAALCSTAASNNSGWAHVSVGRLLRAAASGTDNTAANAGLTENHTQLIRQCIVDGELVPLEVVMQLVESHMAANINSAGVILDGFPRNMQQVAEFENKFKQQPTLILLDCSKLQLGRGRLDDSVSAFRRRLEIFREHSLPMLKTMDNVGRLTIVDGDTDTAPVQEDFMNVVKQHLQFIKDSKTSNLPPQLNHALPSNNAVLNNINLNKNNNNNNAGRNVHQNGGIPNGGPPNRGVPNGGVPNGHVPNGVPNGGRNYGNGYANGHLPNGGDATLHDLEAVTELETISKRVQGNMQNGNVRGMMPNGVGMMNGHAPNGAAIGNGFMPGDKYSDFDQQRREHIRNMYQSIPVDSHI